VTWQAASESKEKAAAIAYKAETDSLRAAADSARKAESVKEQAMAKALHRAPALPGGRERMPPGSGRSAAWQWKSSSPWSVAYPGAAWTVLPQCCPAVVL